MVAASSTLALDAPPGTITSLAALHSLNNDEVARSFPAAFEATVTYYVKGSSDHIVQDGGFEQPFTLVGCAVHGTLNIGIAFIPRTAPPATAC
jgi:hypothetical protein